MLQTIAPPSKSTDETAREVLNQHIRNRIAQCSYRFYFNQVSWHLHDGQLTLHGCVPSFYMKQMLQTLLRDIEGVQQIDNRVEVVSSEGLSSARAR
jgi:osmotically-inducible protein OsmY